MQNHAPTVVGLLEHIGRQDRRGKILPFDRAVQVFIEGHPGNFAAYLNIDIGQCELH
ncbi:hypothetical protein D3C83_282110 [compost metagenome]